MSTTTAATTTITTTDTKTSTMTTMTMSLATPAKTTSHNEKDDKAIYVADTRDRDAPIVLVGPRVRLVAMTGTRQQVQHLHEIATKESRPAVQKTILKIKRSGTILRQN